MAAGQRFATRAKDRDGCPSVAGLVSFVYISFLTFSLAG